MVEKGHRAELNQVSSTSVSCTRSVPPQAGHVSGISMATIISLHLLQVHAGIWCPHQICLEIHQSLMLFIHSK